MILLKHITPTGKDLQEIASFYKSCFNEPEKGENWTNETAYTYFQERVAEQSTFATTTNDENTLIGVCCGSDYKNSFISKELDYNFDACFYISLIALSKQERYKGQGTHMLGQYCDLIQSLSFKNIIVRCRAENMPMRQALKNNDFNEIHEYTASLGGVTCTRIISHKTITTS